jgi:hypothetical protein
LGSVSIPAASGYEWSFTGSLGNNAVIDSGDANSQKIVVRYTSNAAAGAGDSVRLAYTSACGSSPRRAVKLTNTALITPIPSTSITQTLVSNTCGARVYRYSAPALTSATTAATPVPATTGYSWTLPMGTIGATATLDSGSLDGRVIKVMYSSNAASGVTDSIKVAYVSGCGTGANRAVRVLVPVKTGCPAQTKPTNKATAITSAAMSVEVHPNPTFDMFRLVATSATSEKGILRITDSKGVQVSLMRIQTNEVVNFGNELKSGTYFLKLTVGKQQKTMKLVKL